MHKLTTFDFLLKNISNANKGKEQVSVLNELTTLHLISKTSITTMLYLQVTLIYFLMLGLDAKGGTPTLKSWLLRNW